MGLGVVVYYSNLGVSHYMLASKYSNMAKNVPRILQGRTPKTESPCETVAFWAMIMANLAAPICMGVSAYFFRMRLDV